MAHRDIIVMGASAGGIDAISTVLRTLPHDFAASIFIVLHISPQSPGFLPQIFAKATSLAVEHARDGVEFRRGAAYVAPPDHHLLLDRNGRIQLTHGPKENRSRPAVDPLFRSAALAFGNRVIGVVLSGGLDDGTAGLRGIKMCGGVAVVQDPADCLVASMPRTALENVSVDYRAPASGLGALLAKLVDETPAEGIPMDRTRSKRDLELEDRIARGEAGLALAEIGQPSLFTCPECHGALVQLRDERPLRSRCHTGHAFTADSLLADLTSVTEQAVWNAIRSVQEFAMLLTHLAKHWREVDPEVAKQYVIMGQAARSRAEALREVGLRGEDLGGREAFTSTNSQGVPDRGRGEPVFNTSSGNNGRDPPR